MASEYPEGRDHLKGLTRIMNATEIVSFRDYDLLCGARAAEPGRFAPTLVVSRRTWPSRPRVIAMSRGSFATEDDAIKSAHAQGVQWVTDFGYGAEVARGGPR